MMIKKTYDVSLSADIYAVIKAEAKKDERSIRIWLNRYLADLFADAIEENNAIKHNED